MAVTLKPGEKVVIVFQPKDRNGRRIENYNTVAEAEARMLVIFQAGGKLLQAHAARRLTITTSTTLSE